VFLLVCRFCSGKNEDYYYAHDHLYSPVALIDQSDGGLCLS